VIYVHNKTCSEEFFTLIEKHGFNAAVTLATLAAAAQGMAVTQMSLPESLSWVFEFFIDNLVSMQNMLPASF
jgi:hypothetical protein